jgi:hypothetical protein
MPLLIQQYLRGHGTLETLATEYAIKHARHATHTNLVLLKYDQINSPMAELIVRECRGLILDESDHWRIVARPYEKFFNYGEPNAADIDWSTSCVQEKVDGTLCVFYHYAGHWHVATTGLPDARGRANTLPMTFHELIWQAAEASGLRLLSPEHTYLCELTSPHTRVVVAHLETRLTLLGIRHTETGAWASLADRDVYIEGRISAVREYGLGSFAELLATFASLNPLQQEGYVVVDGRGHRVKVKHPAYVSIHLLKEDATPKRYVEVLRGGEAWELLSYFPELAVTFDPIRGAYEALIAVIDADYARLRDIPTQKDFAAEALSTRCSAALFALRAGKCASAREFLATQAQLPFVLRLLGIKEESQPNSGTATH